VGIGQKRAVETHISTAQRVLIGRNPSEIMPASFVNCQFGQVPERWNPRRHPLSKVTVAIQTQRVLDYNPALREGLNMRKSSMLLGLLLIAAGAAVAQDNFPKVETSPAFMYIRTPIGGESFNCAGGGGTIAYNVTSLIGLAADMGGCKIFGNTLGLANTVSGSQFTFLFGPRFTFRSSSRLQPFFEANFGGDHLSISCENAAVCGNASRGFTAFALTAGGGFDVKLSPRFALRLIQAEYMYTRFGNECALAICSQNNSQNSFRLKSGIVIGWGIPPAVSPKAACVGTPPEVLPDDPPVAVSAQPADFSPKHTLQYKWASTGGQVSGSGSSATVDVAGLAPGTYDVRATVSDPKEKKNNTAACTVAFTVKRPRPPVVACSASPSSIQAGSGTPVTISAQASSPDLRKIETRKFSANEGSLQEGTSSAGQQVGQFTSSATLDTKDVQSGPINVTIAVTDVRGLSGSCVASVNVQPLPPPVEVISETLISECQFKNPRKPSRVDNECKAVLDDVAIRLQHEPNGKLVVVGCAEDEEVVTVKQLGAMRAVSVKQYLTGGEGQQQIDPGRIEARTGMGCGKRTQFYFLPPSGTFTQQSTTIVDETQVKP